MALEHPVKSKDVNPLRPVQRRHRAIRDIITACALLATLNIAQAAFLLEIDTDGADDGPVTFNPNFSFGGDTTTASSSVTSPAFGTTGGDSIFGGDGVVEPDTYVYTYTPSVNADNLVIPPGTDLGSGNLATGFTGGGTGTYRVYATWPFTDNVSGGPTRFTLSTVGATDVVVDIDQNGGGAGTGDQWIPLGDIEFTDPNADIIGHTNPDCYEQLHIHAGLRPAIRNTRQPWRARPRSRFHTDSHWQLGWLADLDRAGDCARRDRDSASGVSIHSRASRSLSHSQTP